MAAITTSVMIIKVDIPLAAMIMPTGQEITHRPTPISCHWITPAAEAKAGD
jgi:hypothetical protein